MLVARALANVVRNMTITMMLMSASACMLSMRSVGIRPGLASQRDATAQATAVSCEPNTYLQKTCTYLLSAACLMCLPIFNCPLTCLPAWLPACLPCVSTTFNYLPACRLPTYMFIYIATYLPDDLPDRFTSLRCSYLSGALYDVRIHTKNVL
jgi:hypothetical protein